MPIKLYLEAKRGTLKQRKSKNLREGKGEKASKSHAFAFALKERMLILGLSRMYRVLL